jgi:hypothetical protein
MEKAQKCLAMAEAIGVPAVTVSRYFSVCKQKGNKDLQTKRGQKKGHPCPAWADHDQLLTKNKRPV